MQKSLLTRFVLLAVKNTGKPSNAARNAGVSIVRTLNTRAISETDTSSETLQQQSPEYVSKTSASAKLRSALEISSQALNTISSLGLLRGEQCKAAILHNIESARRSNDEEYVTDHIAKSFELLAAMIKERYVIEEGIYGPLLNYLIDMKMVKEFHMVLEILRDVIPDSSPKFGYYEMLLWIQLKDKEKIEEVCSMIIKRFKELPFEEQHDNTYFTQVGSIHQRDPLTENYMLALCERDQHKDVLRILETLDITTVYSIDLLTSIFKFLGRSLSESVAKKLFRELNNNDDFLFNKDNVSELMFSYVTSISNLWVGGALIKFKDLLEELKVSPSSASYQKLIEYSCDSREEEIGLSILEHMYEVGLEVSPDAATYLFRTIEQNYEFDLLRGVEDVLEEMDKKGDESRMFNLRLAVYIREVLFRRGEPKHREGDGYKPWLKNVYFQRKLDDYEKRFSCNISKREYPELDDYDFNKSDAESPTCEDGFESEAESPTCEDDFESDDLESEAGSLTREVNFDSEAESLTRDDDFESEAESLTPGE